MQNEFEKLAADCGDYIISFLVLKISIEYVQISQTLNFSVAKFIVLFVLEFALEFFKFSNYWKISDSCCCFYRIKSI